MLSILLPGNNPEHNKKYCADFSDLLRSELGIKTETIEYSHWDKGGDTIFEQDKDRLLVTIKAQQYNTEIFFCKSYGNAVLQSVLTELLKNEKFNHKCHIFHFGIPRIPKENVDIEQFLKFLKTGNLFHHFIQQVNDKYLEFKSLYGFLAANSLLDEPNISTFEISGSDHRYDDYSFYLEYIRVSLLK